MPELTNGALRHCADYVRGMTNLPVIVGDLQLPNAARLRLHKNWGVSVPPLGRLPLVPKRSNSGLLYATICEHRPKDLRSTSHGFGKGDRAVSAGSAESEFIGFMEGCVRAQADDGPTIFLSSGTLLSPETTARIVTIDHELPSLGVCRDRGLL